VGTKRTKKSSASSQQEKSPAPKGDPWKDYDYENLPELTTEQIATFKPITTEQHERFLTGTIRSVGRPKKSPSEKENIVAIRFSEVFLERLKAKAKANGFAAWQTYAKKVLAEDLEQPLERVQ